MKQAKELYTYMEECIKKNKAPNLEVSDLRTLRDKHQELKASVNKLTPNHVLCTKCNGVTYFYNKKPLYHTCCGKKINWKKIEKLNLYKLRKKQTP